MGSGIRTQGATPWPTPSFCFCDMALLPHWNHSAFPPTGGKWNAGEEDTGFFCEQGQEDSLGRTLAVTLAAVADISGKMQAGQYVSLLLGTWERGGTESREKADLSVSANAASPQASRALVFRGLHDHWEEGTFLLPSQLDVVTSP